MVIGTAREEVFNEQIVGRPPRQGPRGAARAASPARVLPQSSACYSKLPFFCAVPLQSESSHLSCEQFHDTVIK